MNNKLLWMIAISGLGILTYSVLSNISAKNIDFNTQVKPIINKSCIACHGGVRRAGDYSLLFREEALMKGKSGKTGIVPFKSAESEVIRRINSSDPEEHMPKHGSPLKPEEVAILSQWIDQGAKWGKHWAYLSPKATTVPGKGLFAGFFEWFINPWEKTDIDYFISQDLEKANLKHADKAENGTLLRRLSLDLVGLPPSQQQSQAFITNEGTYENQVDQLLNSPRFGEKWASVWLDLARYSDTKGYERDDVRTIWKYRDWVIDALNNDMPYNQFLTEQLAGDLLPNPTDKQLIATAFHRNTMTNDEGGTDNEEFRTAAVLDRVNTTWEVLNSTTFACVQCHTHPYDPFRHEEYYKFMAFFNDSRDEDTFDDYPQLRHFEPKTNSKLDSLSLWLALNVNQKKSKEVTKFLKTLEPHVNGLLSDMQIQGDLLDNKFLGLRNHGVARFKHINLTGKTELITRHFIPQSGTTWQIRLDSINGQLLTKIKLDTANTGNWKWVNRKYLLPKSVDGFHDLYFKIENPKFNKDLNANLLVWDWFEFGQGIGGNNKKGYALAEQQFWEILNINPARTPIMADNEADRHRPTHIFERGNRLVLGKEVKPDVPASLGGLPKGFPKNRLGLAQWMTSTQNPLTARTIVNRIWEQIYGTGLVETLEDFGTQGFTPVHPELLDYLSLKLMNEYNWSLKKLIKEIVMSASYQQSSAVSADVLAQDPYNRMLARGPRIRLTGEAVRDQALMVSGLLSTKMYGPGVMPFQPEGVWQSPYSGTVWTQSAGEDQFRRAIYTYHKRTSAYPSMMAFDGNSREICVARRIRTNTPLQALVTLNDPVFVEAARKLALKMSTAQTPSLQIKSGYNLLFFKELSTSNSKILEQLYGQALATYQKNPQEAMQLITGASVKQKVSQKHINLAALTVVANAMMNLDEFITKE